MQSENRADLTRYFFIIVITAAIVSVVDLVARAFFYEQAQRFTPYLPLLIGGVALCLIALTQRNRKTKGTIESQTGTAGIRRVRVTGTIK